MQLTDEVFHPNLGKAEPELQEVIRRTQLHYDYVTVVLFPETFIHQLQVCYSFGMEGYGSLQTNIGESVMEFFCKTWFTWCTFLTTKNDITNSDSELFYLIYPKTPK